MAVLAFVGFIILVWCLWKNYSTRKLLGDLDKAEVINRLLVKDNGAVSLREVEDGNHFSSEVEERLR